MNFEILGYPSKNAATGGWKVAGSEVWNIATLAKEMDQFKTPTWWLITTKNSSSRLFDALF